MRRTVLFILMILAVLTVNAQTDYRSGVREDIATKGLGGKPKSKPKPRPKPRPQTNKQGAGSDKRNHSNSGNKDDSDYEVQDITFSAFDSDETGNDTEDFIMIDPTDTVTVPQDSINRKQKR